MIVYQDEGRAVWSEVLDRGIVILNLAIAWLQRCQVRESAMISLPVW